MNEDYTEPKKVPKATKVVRLDEATYDRVCRSASIERRTLSNQLAVLVDRGLRAEDHAVEA